MGRGSLFGCIVGLLLESRVATGSLRDPMGLIVAKDCLKRAPVGSSSDRQLRFRSRIPSQRIEGTPRLIATTQLLMVEQNNLGRGGTMLKGSRKRTTTKLKLREAALVLTFTQLH